MLHSHVSQAFMPFSHPDLGLVCRLIKSKSFLPRVGRLAALQSTSALQESLAHTTLTPRDSPTHGRSPRHRHELQQDGNVTEQNLLQAIDLLKPLLETQERPSSSPRRQ